MEGKQTRERERERERERDKGGRRSDGGMKLLPSLEEKYVRGLRIVGEENFNVEKQRGSRNREGDQRG